jgi:thiamine phosphate synthase YjbQ (UPF0047 family)
MRNELLKTVKTTLSSGDSVLWGYDDESGLHQDYEKCLEGLAPHAPIDQYWHNRTGKDNADAHMKRQVMGREVVVAVTNGRLDGFA